MKYSLRSLMIVVTLIPVLLWGAWLTVCFIARGSKPNYPATEAGKEGSGLTREEYAKIKKWADEN